MNMKHQQQNVSMNMVNLLAGAAAGAAVSAAGMYWMGYNQRQRKQFAKKAARGVENVVSGLENMIEDYMPH